MAPGCGADEKTEEAIDLSLLLLPHSFFFSACAFFARARTRSLTLTRLGDRHPVLALCPARTQTHARTRARTRTHPLCLRQKKMSQPTPMDASADNSLYPIAILM